MRAPMLRAPRSREPRTLAWSEIGGESLLKDPKPAKSFRAAGDRIFRQEFATSPAVGRVLGTPVVLSNESQTDDEAWAVRLAAFATLAQYDAIAFAIGEPIGISRAYNLSSDPFAEPAVQAAALDVARSRAMAQVRSAIPLGDGRTAGAAIVVPLIVAETTGTLVGLRVGRTFAAADALATMGIAELVTLELRRAQAARRESAERRQALALYELGRLALFATEQADMLASVVALLRDELGHDLVQVWLLEPSGALQRSAGVPETGLPLRLARPFEHEPLADVLTRGETVRLRHPSPRSWIPDHVADVIVAPLAATSGAIGLLIAGRSREPFARSDEDLAGMLGSFVGQLLARGPSQRQSDEEEPVEWEGEPAYAAEAMSSGSSGGSDMPESSG